MTDLKEIIIEGARSKGICDEGYKRLLDSESKADMVDYYIANPDWCMERGFPNINTLREQFSDCEDKGVYIDKEFKGELLNDLQAYIFHNCRGTIKVCLNVEKAIIPMLYLGNGCRLRIVGVGDGIGKPVEVPIYTFGRNDLSARDNRHVVFRKYKMLVKK